MIQRMGKLIRILLLIVPAILLLVIILGVGLITVTVKWVVAGGNFGNMVDEIIDKAFKPCEWVIG